VAPHVCAHSSARDLHGTPCQVSLTLYANRYAGFQQPIMVALLWFRCLQAVLHTDAAMNAQYTMHPCCWLRVRR
jgi:hypothetical protein